MTTDCEVSRMGRGEALVVVDQLAEATVAGRLAWTAIGPQENANAYTAEDDEHRYLLAWQPPGWWPPSSVLDVMPPLDTCDHRQTLIVRWSPADNDPVAIAARKLRYAATGMS